MRHELAKTFISYLTLVLTLLGLYAISFYQPIQTLTITKELSLSEFHFTGIIAPMEYSSILSPVDGYISEVRTEFGNDVKKGQTLFVIHSTKEVDELFSAWSNYVKARSGYQNSLFKLQGNKELYKGGLISKITLMDSEETLKNAELELSSSEQKLISLLDKVKISSQMVKQFSVENAQYIQKIIEKALQGITVTSPIDGILLFPSKSFGSFEEISKAPIQKGASVKGSQVIAIVSNKNRLEIKIKILETDLHKIQKGDFATITGGAFANIKLNGYIYSINSQADASDDQAAASTYTAFIHTPALTKAQKEIIEVGMSAEITIKKKRLPIIRIPLNAIYEKDGQYWVKILANNNEVKNVVIIPGKTSEDSVEIIKGLSVGDKLVLSH